MISKLAEYEPGIWRFDPGRPSAASQGLCSRCSQRRRATHMLIGRANRPVAALCMLHAKLFQINEQRSEIREALHSDSLASIVLE